jgi:hypothetical protein
VGLVRDYKAACQVLREQLLAGRLATAEEVASYWPGGTENELKGLRAWIYCREQYGRIAAKVEQRFADRAADGAAKRAAVLEAIAETPERVELVSRDANGEPRSLTVFQKSDLALRKIHECNVLLGWLVDDYHQRQPDSPDDLEIIVRSLREQSYLQRLIVWIATTEGPGLPFTESAHNPVLPDELSTLHSLDFYSLAQAMQRVNVAGFAALEAGTAPQTRPSWSVFWSGAEHETGIPAPKLMRDRGLLSLVASNSELVRGREEAQARAEQESKRKAG